MKVLITTDLYTIKTNGVVTSVRHLYNELKAKGHDVRILTLSDKAKSSRDGDVYYIRSMPIGIYPGIRMPLSYRHRLIREIIEWKPDVIHSQCEIFTMQFAKRISKHTGAPIVHTYHTMYEEYIGYVIPGKRFGRKIVRQMTRMTLKKVRVVIVPTKKIQRVLEGYSLNKRICVVPSGIDLDQHKKMLTPEQRSEKRREYGIEDHQFVMVNLGRLGFEKNIDELIRGFAVIYKENKDVFFMIVGDGPAKEKLQKTAKELGVSDRVIFTGMVNPTEVQNYYQLGDVFVSASTSETQGLTYIEAAANGLPLVCRKDPCLEGVVEQGVNGYAYTTEEELTEALKTVLNDKEWRIAASETSRANAAVFDKERFRSSVEELYSSVTVENK